MKINEVLGNDFEKTIRDFVNSQKTVNELVYYTGKVINNNDPKMLGRVQVKVYGVYDDSIPNEDLPWALPDYGFIGSKVGSFIVPPVDTIVNVYFEQGDYNLPKYSKKTVDGTSLTKMKSNIEDDYPDTLVFFETDEGDYFKLNRRTGEMVFRHNKGSVIRITEQGKIVLDAGNDVNINVAGKLTLNTGEDLVLNAGENIILKTGSFDSMVWKPNCLPNCLLTGAPHSMTNQLKGS